MSRGNDNDQAALVMLLGLAVVAVIGFVVWKFSNLLGLDMATGGQVLLGLVTLLVCVGVLWWSDWFEMVDIAPAALAGLWLCFWPALTYWGAESSLVPAFAQYDDPPTAWWSAWYTKWGVLVAILVIGYAQRWYQRRW